MNTWLGTIGRRPATSQIERVLDAGLCTGCGACAVSNPDSIQMVTVGGARQARIVGTVLPGGPADHVCPFSDLAPNEDFHAKSLYGDAPQVHPKAGSFRATYAGHVSADDQRTTSSSGGLTTWFLQQLLAQGVVDAVVHVSPKPGSELFAFSISTTPEEISMGSRTRYYSVSMENALRDALATDSPFALVGVPCFIKAARNLALVDRRMESNLRVAVGLVCGHMKSQQFAESLAWQLGVEPDKLSSVDFRTKLAGRPASAYGFTADTKEGQSITAPVSDLHGTGWDGGYFKLLGCECCDDVSGETADVAFGDAWLPAYASDSAGTNVAVARSELAQRFLSHGRSSGQLRLDEIPVEDFVASQAAGLRDRREDLAFRLWVAKRTNSWRPQRRVAPSAATTTTIRKITVLSRMATRRVSYASYELARRVGSPAPIVIVLKFSRKWLFLLKKVETLGGFDGAVRAIRRKAFSGKQEL